MDDNHPGVELSKLWLVAGKASPLSVAEQWQRVEAWHRFLQSDAVDEYPVLAGLKEIWSGLEEIDAHGKPLIEREPNLKNISSSPLSSFFYFVDMGFYPPPELMLALHDCLQCYEGSRGDVSLEEAFFGKPKKGAGNYSGRSYSRRRMIMMRWEFDGLLREGKSRNDAAESLSTMMGGKPDADSILRVMRGFNGFFAKKREEK